ncbi:MAG: ABC transporter substrate-binding protein [Bacteroidetes bacterium]|nr:ABC transporter substrate-binding protein [Bacteroidota bacterium]
MNAGEISFTDQLGREIFIPRSPRRIISLVPSQTELLHELGLEEEVVGITKFCIHPEEWYLSKKKIGGTKDFKPDVIRELQPDLILANKEENTAEGLAELMGEFPVWISDVNSLEEALSMIRSVGEMTNRKEQSGALIQQIEENFNQLKAFLQLLPHQQSRVAYYIWKEPWMIAGKSTFINSLLQECGLSSIGTKTRYPEINFDELHSEKPDFIFLSSEPFPFKASDKTHFSEIISPDKVIMVDGEYFSWYGSRLKNAPSYFKSLLKSLPGI